MTAALTPERLAELRRVAHDASIHRQRMCAAGLNVPDTGFTTQVLLTLLDAADERDRLAGEVEQTKRSRDGWESDARIYAEDSALYKSRATAAEATARRLGEIAAELLDRKDTGASEDAHIFGEWDTLRDFLSTPEVKALMEARG